MRLLTNETRKRVESVITRLGDGMELSLQERIELRKYSTHIPFIAGKVNKALQKRVDLESEGLL